MPGTIPRGTAVLWHSNDFFLKAQEWEPTRPPFTKQKPPKPDDPHLVVLPHFIPATDMGGNVLVKVQDPPDPPNPDYGTRAIGIAFDGTNLWFSNQDQGGAINSEIQKRTADGLTKLGEPLRPLVGGAGNHTVDIAFDTKRGHLWQMEYGTLSIVEDPPGPPTGRIIPNPNAIAPTLTRIDLANPGSVEFPAPTLGTITLPVPPGFELGGGYGVTYDSDNDLLYFSLSNIENQENPVNPVNPVNPTPGGAYAITAGVVYAMAPSPTLTDPTKTEFTGEGKSIEKLFEMPFAIAGLGFQTGKGTLNGQGTLWAGGEGVVRHLTLAGDLLATVTSPDNQFLNGLEFVGG